jgi:hypothetical protein
LGSPTQQLGKFLKELEHSPETQHRLIAQKAQIQSAIEISEALTGLTVAVNSMANQGATVGNNLLNAIKEASAQAKKSAEESTRAAKESANLSGRLNSLTVWIIAAAILSAIAAFIQAGVALYAVFHPAQ